jgi:hypothetical protein
MSSLELPLSRYLRTKNIANAATARSVLSKMNEAELFELSGDCSGIIKSISCSRPASRLFNFSASNSICGAGNSCYGLSCRLSEATDLGKFAALYGDCVTIPDFLAVHRDEYRAYKKQSMALPLFKEHLVGDVVVLALYEPLFIEGLMRFNSNKVAHCAKCLARQITSDQKKTTIKKSPELIRLAKDVLMQKVNFKFDGTDSISFEDPFGYTNLEGHSVSFDNPDFLRDVAAGEISVSEINRTKIADREAAKIVDDILQQTMGQMLDSATFLTPRRIDGLLLDSLNSDLRQNTLEPSTLPANLAHSIPIISDSSFEALVNVRHEDEPHFERYKNSLATVLRQLGPEPTQQMVRDALDGEVKPHLLKINQALKVHRDEQNRGVRQNVVTTGAMVTLGLAITGSSHLDAGAAAGVLGALMATPAYKAANSILNRNTIPKEANEDQYYFLWQRGRTSQ